MDKISTEQRSAIMAKIKGKNTGPEMIVRSLLHGIGHRFRLHRRNLPGIPDIVLPRLKTVVFVHGCFWHMHQSCNKQVPKSNTDFWRKKLYGNVLRDLRHEESLNSLGWRVLTIWECETKRPADLLAKLKNLLPRPI